MANDIYDLVQRSIAQKRAGMNQFRDPTVDMMMEIPKLIESERDRALAEENAAISNFASMVPLSIVSPAEPKTVDDKNSQANFNQIPIL